MTNTDQPAPNNPSTSTWLTPGVAGIGMASLLADVGHEIPTALLPSLLVSTLGAPASALGAIEGVSDALAGLAKLGGGTLADDPDRRRSVAVGGYAATAVLSAGIGAATATWHVAILRAGAWTARGLRGYYDKRCSAIGDLMERRSTGPPMLRPRPHYERCRRSDGG